MAANLYPYRSGPLHRPQKKTRMILWLSKVLLVPQVPVLRWNAVAMGSQKVQIDTDRYSRPPRPVRHWTATTTRWCRMPLHDVVYLLLLLFDFGVDDHGNSSLFYSAVFSHCTASTLRSSTNRQAVMRPLLSQIIQLPTSCWFILMHFCRQLFITELKNWMVGAVVPGPLFLIFLGGELARIFLSWRVRRYPLPEVDTYYFYYIFFCHLGC